MKRTMKREELVELLLASSPGAPFLVRRRDAEPSTPWTEFTSLDDMDVEVTADSGKGDSAVINGVDELGNQFEEEIEYDIRNGGRG